MGKVWGVWGCFVVILHVRGEVGRGCIVQRGVSGLVACGGVQGWMTHEGEWALAHTSREVAVKRHHDVRRWHRGSGGRVGCTGVV